MERRKIAVTGILSILMTTILIVSAPNATWAQGGSTGAITGTVLDRSGGFIPNAAVKLIDAGTGQQIRGLAASSNGNFTIALLPPGNYTVVVNAAGFGETRATAVVVRVTETTTISVVLQPSGLSERVEVSAQVVSVNTENATTGQTIEQQVVSGLPLATRNFQQLLTLSSGASSTLNNSEQLGRGTVRINVNGQRGDNNNYLIEGVSATDNNVGELTNTPLPSPDVILEFKVQTSLYDASQGRNGGGMVNAVLRTGTNEWHGDAFEFFRNDVFNASDFFLNRAGLPRPELKQNIFGGSVGGPLGSEGKFGYIFGNYQGSRQRSGADLGTLIGTVLPVLPADRSDASLLATFFPGNPNAKIDPVVSKLLNAKGNQFCSGASGALIPSIPGVPGQSANFNCSNPGRFSDNQFTTNWDRKFRDGKEKFGVRFFFSNSDALKPFGGGGLTSTYGAPPSKTDLNFPLDIPVNTRFLAGSWTHTFSGEKVNQFTFGYNRINNAYTNVPPIKRGALGITSPTDSATNSIYKFTFNSSGFQIGPSPGDNSQIQNNFTYGDVFSWVRGKHELRFGGEWDRINLYKLFPQIFNDQIFFGNTPAAPLANPPVPAFTDVQNFLLGAPLFVFGQSGAFNHDYHHNSMSLFAQDDWKATQNLTLNVGLRMEEYGAWYDNACHIGNFDPSLIAQNKYPYIYPKCVNKFNVPGLQGTASSTTLNNSYTRGWGPRIGLAFDLFGHHKTTVRAGFGIYYVQQDVGAVDNLSFQSPLLDVVSFGGPGGCLATFFQPGNMQPANCQGLNPNPNALPPAGVISPAFVPVLSQIASFPNNDTSQAPSLINNGVNLFTLQVPRHFRVPSVQQWNLTIQRSLGRDWVLEVGYVGSHSVHLREVHDALQSILVSPQNPLSVPLANGTSLLVTKNTNANAIIRTSALGVNGYGAFEKFADDAYGHYNSIQTTLSRRWSNGYIQAAYTFSRSTDASSSYNTAFNTLFNNQLNLNGTRGLSDFDRTHRLAVSYVYNLPFYTQSKDWKAKVLGGWSLSGVTVFQSGLPFSIFDSSAGSAFDALTTIPNTTASLLSGKTLANGLTSGSIGSRLGGLDSNGNLLKSYLDITAFTLHAPVIGDDGLATGFGTLGRNTYRGPFQQNWDVSLIKSVSITEHQKIRFTSDFFNVWNHPVFSNPAFTDVQNPAGFGQIISTENNPRILQFSLTWSF